MRREQEEVALLWHADTRPSGHRKKRRGQKKQSISGWGGTMRPQEKKEDQNGHMKTTQMEKSIEEQEYFNLINNSSLENK